MAFTRPIPICSKVFVIPEPDKALGVSHTSCNHCTSVVRNVGLNYMHYVIVSFKILINIAAVFTSAPRPRH